MDLLIEEQQRWMKKQLAYQKENRKRLQKFYEGEDE